MNDVKLFATLLPSFPHFPRFAADGRLAGIRFNSAKTTLDELAQELALVKEHEADVPVWFDVKGRQPRVTEVLPNPQYLEFRVNHPLQIEPGTDLLFKAGTDRAILGEVSEAGRRLLCSANPHWNVTAGDSLHFDDPDFRNLADPIFTPLEVEKIAAVRAAGIKRWFLSYVECQRDVDQLLELTGKDAEVMLKIETRRGLEYAANEFRKRDGLTLVCARGDLFVELRPAYQIAAATRMLVERDPEAMVGSRILLSSADGPVPSCADISELAWLFDIGYKNLLLCDDLCLKEGKLERALDSFEEFRRSYRPTQRKRTPAVRRVK